MTDHHAVKRGEATVLVAPSYRNWKEKLQPCCSLTGLHTLFVHLRGYTRTECRGDAVVQLFGHRVSDLKVGA